MNLVMTTTDWMALLGHFLSLSLLAVGGAIALAPDMHRYLVDERQWLTDPEFASSIALAQAAPGPNVLFIALLGWNVGLNTGGYGAALLGMLLAMTGVLVPSATLTYAASRWAHRNRTRRSVRAFKLAMAPIVVALLLATAWLLSAGMLGRPRAWLSWSVTLLCMLIVWRTRIHLLWLLGAGALLGALGWI
jgi:chromate transporter